MRRPHGPSGTLVRRGNGRGGGRLLDLAADAAGMHLRAPEQVSHAVLRVMLERIVSGSAPGRRSDPHVLCLAVEGGGMRGAVSAGMCVVLEAAGVVDAFDRVYGVSAGALNAWATAVGQAALSATHYEDAVDRRVIDPIGPLRGRPVVDFDLLFEELIGARKPLSFERLSAGPELRVLATSLDSMSLRVLDRFADAAEVLSAVRASSALPRLAGQPPTFRGERMADGGLIEPIPFATAMVEGATHILVLRTRPRDYRRPAMRELGDLIALRDNPPLLELVRARHGIYNRQARTLERAEAEGLAGVHIQQVAVPLGTRLIGRLEADACRVMESLRLGAHAMASTILAHPVDLCWQPVVYRGSSTTAA